MSGQIDLAPFRELYPFESHWFELEGMLGPVMYHYLDQGPRDAPPVVMLHGNPTWSFYYRDLISQVSETYRVIVPDHIGCGLSDKPQHYSYTLAQHAENVERLIGWLGLRDVTLVVHDWGGMIGFRYAVRYPQNIARLVVLNTAAFYQPKLPRRIKFSRLPVVGEFAVRGLNAFARLALAWAAVHQERLTPQVRAGYLAPYDSWQNRIAIYRFVQDIPFERRHHTRALLEEVDSKLSCFRQHPMMIAWGAQDFCFTTEHFLSEWQKRFPQAEVHVIEDAGHYVVEDAHERIGPWMLDFMQRT